MLFGINKNVSQRHCRFQSKAWNTPIEQQTNETSVCKTVYLDVVGIRESRSVLIPVLLIIVPIASQYGCQSLVVSFCQPIGLTVVYRGKQTSNFSYLTTL